MELPEEPLRRLDRLEREVSRLRAELLPERRIEELPEALDVLLAVVAGGLIAFPLDAVLEVIPRVPFTPLPEAPPHMPGHMRWRGAHVPVVDTTFLWTGHELTPRRLEDRVVVVRHAGRPHGLLVPEVLGVDRFRRAEWDAVRAGAGGGELAVALAHRPEGSVLLVSLPHLFAAAPLPAQEGGDAAAAAAGEAVP